MRFFWGAVARRVYAYDFCFGCLGRRRVVEIVPE